MLPENEIADLRMEVESAFDHLLDIYRDPEATPDDYGGYGSENSRAKVCSEVPCEIYPGIAHVVDMLDQGQLVDTQLYTITVPVGTDVLKGDVVVITSWNDLNLQVNVVFEPESLELEKRFVADKEIL